MSEKLELYTEGEGTIKISKFTAPCKAGLCAYHYLCKGLPRIEFLSIGSNANHVASMSLLHFAECVARDPNFAGRSVAFVPRRYLTLTHNKETGEDREKYATVWQTILVDFPGSKI